MGVGVSVSVFSIPIHQEGAFWGPAHYVINPGPPIYRKFFSKDHYVIIKRLRPVIRDILYPSSPLNGWNLERSSVLENYRVPSL